MLLVLPPLLHTYSAEPTQPEAVNVTSPPKQMVFSVHPQAIVGFSMLQTGVELISMLSSSSSCFVEAFPGVEFGSF